MKLALANFFEILATLDESFVLGEDSVFLSKVRVFSVTVVLYHPLHLLRDFSVLVAALNAFIEVCDALFDISTKHVLCINLVTAALDDLVADLGQQTLHLLVSVVESRTLPNHTHVVKYFR